MKNLKKKYSLIFIVLSFFTILTISYATDNLELRDILNFTNVSGTPVIKEIIKQYSFVGSSYANFDLFALDKIEFNKYPTRFCGEHGAGYGNQDIDHILEDVYHVSNVLTKSRYGTTKTSNPLGDIDTSADVYCDSNGNLVRKDKNYYGYRENTTKETPSGSVKTNWVYIEQKLKFDCEGSSSGMSGSHISDGGMAFLLACYKQPGSRVYTADPLQWAVWDWINGYTTGHVLDSVAQIYDEYHIKSENPNVDCIPGDNVGTVLKGDTYHVGPFTMSNYVRAQDFAVSYGGSSGALGFNHYTNLQEAFDSQGDYKGTIVKAEAVMNNGARVEFPVPEPGAEFYIDLPGSQIAGADELVDIVFTYQRIHASGNGSLWKGYSYVVTYDEESANLGCGTYHCSKHPEHSHGGCGCDYSHTVEYTKTDGTTGSYTCNHCKGDHTDCHGHSRLSYGPYGDKAYCSHGHWDCYRFKWKYVSSSNEAQDGFAGNGALAIEVDTYTIKVSIPVKTVMKIYKYIEQVDHVGENINLYPKQDTRMPMTMDEKFNDTVKVERGDLVTYRIVITNESRFKTRVKVKDILPTDCEKIYMPPEIEASKWIEVDANDKREFIVQVIPIKAEGKYTNTIEFITTNSSAEHMQFVHWGDDATHGPREYGNIVNTDGKDGTTNLKEKDSDTYEIKQYNVNIEKYIYDVNHVPDNVATSKLDTTIRATDERSVVNKMTEEIKQANPVYAEYGDTVTYKIKIYNTTNKYDGGINRNNAPYWNPDKVYVNIEDTLPKKYKDLKITVSNGTGAITSNPSSTNGGKFTIKNLMVPPDGITTVTVTLVVDEHTKGTVETNSVKFIDEIRNINKGPGNGNNVDNKYCVIKNNPIRTETKDYYKLNNYNAFIDKYVYEYDEKVQKENNNSTLTKEDLITNDDGTLKTSRRNDSTQTSTISDGNVIDKVREPNGKDEYKQNHPVSAEKDENLVYHIKVSNEATTVNKNISTGIKPATQVRTTKVTDKMQLGLQQKRVTAKMYNADGTICNRYAADGSVKVNVSSPVLITENGRQYNKYEYTIGNETILNPGEYIIYSVEVLITGTDMYLYNLENNAELTILTNINNVKDPYQVQTPTYTENISKQQKTTEYVRMKDLVIAGKVWLDFNKNGLMDDTITDYVAQTKDESLYRKDPSKLSTYYSINENAMMKDIVVKLYTADGTLVRTTKTDGNGLFTFGRDENLSWYESGYNHDKQYSSSTTYQRIDKATGKDGNGNYTSGSKYIEYYVEYEYDGVVYKATAYSGKDHLNNDGSYKGAACNHSFETNTNGYATDNYTKETAPSQKYKYEYDSNANEFVNVRETFNTNYDYITYNQAYSINNTTEPGSNLAFDKTDHTSQLLVDHNRKMTARSFIEELTQPNVQEATDYIPLYDYSSSNVTVPYSRYLKFINLGLELREDVDISLTKDVYKLKTTIKGEEMEYNFNENTIINGDVLAEVADNYKLDKPYGIELYESDYKFRNEQYSSIKAVQDYLSEQSELNAEVTYRIRINNNKANKDADLKDPSQLTGSYDSKNFEDTSKTDLYVKVDEVLDLYDENFIEYTEGMEKGTEKDFIEVRDLDPKTGRFTKDDKQIKIAEAWYYKPNGNGKYIKDDATGIYIDTTKEDVDVAGAQRYEQVPLKVSNNAIKGSTNEYINSGKYKPNNDNEQNAGGYDGYHKLYISGMQGEKIGETEHLDIFVKYVLEKSAEDITVTNENWDETVTKSSEEIYDIQVNDDGSYKWTQTSSTETNSTTTTSMMRSLIIKEHTTTPEKQAYGLATENIAQVNLYSVWYAESDKPASLVDKDSNAGNVGMKDTINKVIDSADNKKLYEDTIYKAGIDIAAEGTANTVDENKWRNQVENGGNGGPDIIRFINGHVWDDSRSETSGTPSQYIGNGLRYSGEAIEEAKKNELVPIVKGESVTEEKDIPVSSAKAEFIEIVETAENTYYEITPTDISSDYRQHVRSGSDGEYELYGYTPGKYVVRFTYGDNIEQNREEGIVEQTAGKIQASQEDMYLFNGQDYKSTQYTMPNVDNNGNVIKNGDKAEVLNDDVVLYNHENKTNDKEILKSNQEKIDKVIASLEAKDYNDARDDEIRRLETNSYSEIMDNMMAEILQGMANGKGLTNNADPNTDVELKALVDNTWMFAETIPFTVRAEKIDKEHASNIAALIKDATYGNRAQLEKELTGVRTFTIENVDFGIEYRPENAVQLEKDIKEVKVTTESGDTVVDLHFYTEYKDLTNTDSVKVHHLDTDKSVGLDMIQFISNDYATNDLVSKLISEKNALQGFVYINYDIDIQQGATVEITYEYIAENHGEVDRISKNLDDIRYQDNYAVTNKVGAEKVISNIINNNTNRNGVTNYRSNLTAANDMIDMIYRSDGNGDVYRTSPKLLTKTDNTRVTNDKDSSLGDVSRNKVSYYGYYEGYTYYTGKDETEFDTVAELKFNKILDYVDKDMLYLDSTTGEKTLNKHWSVLNNIYGEYYSTIGWARSDTEYVASISNTNGNKKVEKSEIDNFIDQNIRLLGVSSVYEQIGNTDNLTGSPIAKTSVSEIKGASIDPDGYIYENMLLSTDTGMYTDKYIDENRTLSGAVPGTNPSVSRFLLPMVADHDNNEFDNSRGRIQLTVSKAISAETSDDELQYENIGEIVEFTTLTGRRTNFATTIGNVDLRKLDIPNNTPDEYPQSVPESDQSSTEVVTLIPPQGLMKRDRVIKDVVEIAKTGTGIVAVIVAVAVVGVFVTMFAIRKYQKRRIK